MKNLVNRVQLIGNLGHDPEMKTFGENQTLARFSLATPENYKNKEGEWVNESMWHNVVAWGPVAKRVEQKLFKGTKVAISGKLVNRAYETKNGEKRYVTEVVMDDMMVFTKTEQTVKADLPF